MWYVGGINPIWVFRLTMSPITPAVGYSPASPSTPLDSDVRRTREAAELQIAKATDFHRPLTQEFESITAGRQTEEPSGLNNLFPSLSTCQMLSELAASNPTRSIASPSSVRVCPYGARRRTSQVDFGGPPTWVIGGVQQPTAHVSIRDRSRF